MRKRYARITDFERAAIIKDYIAGVKCIALAAQYNISPSYARKLFMREGGREKRKQQHKVDKDVRDAIVQDYLLGVLIKTISDKYHVSKAYPGVLARRRGFPSRIRGRR